MTGSSSQYTYDANGNLTGDSRDGNNIKQDMKYDHRNLLIELRLVKPSSSILEPNDEIHQVLYNYDESGNRVRKRVYLYTGLESTPVYSETDLLEWSLVEDEYYSRDLSGKEIAVYASTSLNYWNVWGTDNAGKIKADGTKYFYLKDHLGTIRVVLNESNQIVSANDYDPWGYPLDGRSYQSDNTDYKFTGKQRDNETGYDYFGARYYDARIANWGSVDPLFEKHIQWTPYNYVLRNPMVLIDPDGRQVNSSYGQYLVSQQLLSGTEPNTQILNSYLSSEILKERMDKFPTKNTSEDAVEQTGDEMILAGPIVSALKEISLGKAGAKIIADEIGTSLVVKEDFQLSAHALENSLKQGITKDMISVGLKKGSIYTGHESGAFTFILEKATAKGKNLVIGFNPLNKKVVTNNKYKKISKTLMSKLTPVNREWFNKTFGGF